MNRRTFLKSLGIGLIASQMPIQQELSWSEKFKIMCDESGIQDAPLASARVYNRSDIIVKRYYEFYSGAHWAPQQLAAINELPI